MPMKTAKKPDPRNPYRIEDPESFMDELCRADFPSFVARAFAHIRGGAKLKHNWHIDAMAQSLNRVDDGDCRRLLITLPPRNLKSILISVAWVAFRLGYDPSLNFVCVSYASTLSLKHAHDCRSIMQSDWYRRMFPRTRISPTRGALNDFETTCGGGRLSTSIGGTLTGRGGAIIVVMQRLHQYDPVGMMIEDGGWDHFSLPAIATVRSVYPLTRGRLHHRRVGDVLHPAHESHATLMEIKQAQGSVLFQAQYQQDPVPAEGNIIHVDWLKIYSLPTLELGGQIVQSWDTASKDGLFNDYSVCITARVVGNRVYILNVMRRKMQFSELYRTALAMARDHRADVLLIEDQSSGEQLIQRLRDEEPRGVPAPIARRPDADKKTRLAGISNMIEAGQLLLPEEAPWLGEFKRELLAFPSSRHDDQVDALSQLMSWVSRNNRYDSVIAGPELYTYCNGVFTVTDEHGTRPVEYDSRMPPDYDPWGIQPTSLQPPR
jgi:predicted phage terminase large subunit-like protein